MNQRLIEEAKHCFFLNKFQECEALLQQATEENPQHIEPRFHLANLYATQHRNKEAIEVLNPISHANSIDLQWLLFRLHRHAGHLKQASQIGKAWIHHPEMTSDRLLDLYACARDMGHWAFAMQLAKDLNQNELIKEINRHKRLIILLRSIPPPLRDIFIRNSYRLLQKFHRVNWLRIILQCAFVIDQRNSEWPLRQGQNCHAYRDVYDPQFEQELYYYHLARTIDSNNKQIQENIIRVLYDMGHWRNVLREIESIHNPPKWIVRIQAACLTNLSDYEKALSFYEGQQNKIGVDHASFNRALIYLAQRNLKKASDSLSFESQDESLVILRDFFRKMIEKAKTEQNMDSLDGQEILDSLSKVESSIAAINEAYPCPLCGSTSEKSVLWQDTTTGWKRARCTECTMISVTPLPSNSQIRALYDNTQRDEHALARRYRDSLQSILHATEDQCHALPLYKDITQWGGRFSWREFEQSLGREKRYLDIGCSAGYAVKLFQQCGWKAEGIDLDPTAVEFGRSKGLVIHLGSLDVLRQSERRYHLITLIDVIEHIDKPREWLQQCYDLLFPGGLMYIKTPCSDSLPHRFIGNRWLESSEHLHFFSRKTLAQLSRQTGLSLIALRQTMDAPTNFLHPKQWQEQYYPQLLHTFIHQWSVGDTIRILLKKA